MRVKNSIRTMATVMITDSTNTLLSFIVRTVFIRTLSAEYLGVNGLFSNILMMLSLAELGIGNAIIFNLYKSVATGDKEKTKSLMRFYKVCYQIIGVIVAILGILIIPFLGKIIKDNKIANINLIYCLYLLNTVSSYFFAYKRSIIFAYQRQYILNMIGCCLNTIMAITQIFILIISRNFYLYLTVQIIFSILQNIIIAAYANKKYPFIKDKKVLNIDKGERKLIFKDVRALVLYKIAATVTNGTDNIIISGFLGVYWVGLYSNYYLIISAVRNILNKVLGSITASVGNLNALSSKKEVEKLYLVVNFFNFWMYAIFVVGFFVLLRDFIGLWVGEQYILTSATGIVIILNFYISGMQQVNIIFRNTMGLFVQGKYRPVVMAIMNVILSLIFVEKLGVFGVLFATSIASILTTVWFDPYVIYKYGFCNTPWTYYKRYITYILIIVVLCIIDAWLCGLIFLGGFLGFIFKAFICFVTTNIILILLFFRSDEFLYIKKRLRPILVGFLKRII